MLYQGLCYIEVHYIEVHCITLICLLSWTPVGKDGRDGRDGSGIKVAFLTLLSLLLEKFRNSN